MKLRIMLDPEHPIAELLRRDKRFHFDAYVFVFEALRFAQEKLGMGKDQRLSDETEAETKEESTESGECVERHVSGQELCNAIRLYAMEQYGYMAKPVLNHWGVSSTSDFGEIVFNLIDIGQMRKTSSDRREDFDDVFDFDAGLRESYQISLPDSSEERRS